jgi:hypothetical protein
MKACEGSPSKWPDLLPHALFADRITTSSVTGFSPYQLLYGVDPLLPFDLTEATFMIDGYTSGLSTAELLALRIRQLEKKPEDLVKAAECLQRHRFRSKEQFEQRFFKRIVRTIYHSGELVLIRNTQVEKNLDRKVKPRYVGPVRVVRKTKGGSYQLEELDGTPLSKNIGAFRIIPYIARNEKVLKALADDNLDLDAVLNDDFFNEGDEEDSDSSD